ncbi:MAG TPA: hypothetical protein DCR93_34120 [Cytophagales bacterium]|nr:hypothetical protein [Cytophagales bacterium]
MKNSLLSLLTLSVALSCVREEIPPVEEVPEEICPYRLHQDLVVLRTQEEVQAFADAGYTHTGGQLWIGNFYGEPSNITDLSPLACLQVVGTNLNISNAERLKSLAGLSGLQRIGSQLTIVDNDSLISLGGMDQLTTVVSNVSVMSNAQLPSLDGLESITEAGSVIIQDNPQLTSLAGLRSITQLWLLKLWNLPRLQTLEGLEALTHIGDGLSLFFLDSLQNIDPLAQLEAAGPWLNLNELPLVQNVDALSGVTFADPLSVRFFRNLALVDLCGLTEPIGALDSVDWGLDRNGYNPTLEELLDGECARE